MRRARFNDRIAAVRALKRAARWQRRAARLGLKDKPPGHIAETIAAAARAKGNAR